MNPKILFGANIPANEGKSLAARGTGSYNRFNCPSRFDLGIVFTEAIPRGELRMCCGIFGTLSTPVDIFVHNLWVSYAQPKYHRIRRRSAEASKHPAVSGSRDVHTSMHSGVF